MHLSLHVRIMAQKKVFPGTVFVITGLPEKRIRVTKSQQELEDLDDNSTDMYSSLTLLSAIASDQTQFLLLINFVLLSLQPVIIKTIRKDSDEKRDAQPEVLTDVVMQTQHSFTRHLTSTQSNIYEHKRKSEMQKSQSKSIDIILSSVTYVLLSMEN